MLVLESFRGHLTDSVKEKCQKEKCDVVVIPGGVMGMLQPHNLSIDRPFMANLRGLYHNWISSTAEMMPTGHIKKAFLSRMCKWIAAAWKEISPYMVHKSFKVISISNAIHGSEDDAVWCRPTTDTESESSDHDSDADQ